MFISLISEYSCANSYYSISENVSTNCKFDKGQVFFREKNRATNNNNIVYEESIEDSIKEGRRTYCGRNKKGVKIDFCQREESMFYEEDSTRFKLKNG